MGRVRADVLIYSSVLDHGLPQTLQALGVLVYSPPLAQTVRSQVAIARGGSWEVQMRGCSVWYV